MNTTLDNISKLLKMLDNPSIYTEQEIQDIINSNGETRKTYHLMVAAKQGYRHRQTHGGKDTDTSWQQFEQKNYTKQDFPLPQVCLTLLIAPKHQGMK